MNVSDIALFDLRHSKNKRISTPKCKKHLTKSLSYDMIIYRFKEVFSLFSGEISTLKVLLIIVVILLKLGHFIENRSTEFLYKQYGLM